MHWTDTEREYVFSGDNGGVRMDRAEELRVAHISSGRGEHVDVIAHATAEQKTEEKKEVKEEQEAVKQQRYGVAEKKAKYEELSGKRAVGKWGTDEEWLDKKIAELTK